MGGRQSGRVRTQASTSSGRTSSHRSARSTTNTSHIQVSTSNLSQQYSRKRQPSPVRSLRPTKRSCNRTFRPPSIRSGSDNESSEAEINDDEDDNGDDGGDENEFEDDMNDHFSGLDNNEVQSAFDSEAIRVSGNIHNKDGSNNEDTNHDLVQSDHRYQAEVPQWSSSSRLKNGLENDDDDDDDDDVHYTEQYGHRRLLHLRKQTPELRKVFTLGHRAALKQALSNTFFIVNDSGYTALTTMLEKIAADLNFTHLVATFQQDFQASQNIARIIYHRLTLRRSKVKKIAEGLVGFFFEFDNSGATPEIIQTKVNDLNLKSAYIFPVEKNTINASKPYEHPVIIRVLRKFLFDDGARKNTLGETYSEIFASNSNTLPEMPVGLVCLAATGVHAAISDWSTGVYKRTDFVVDIVEDVYRGHQEYLASLAKRSPSKYHALLHRIYVRTRAYLPTIGHSIAQGLSDLVDFDGLEDLEESATAVEESGSSSSAGSFLSAVSQSL